MYMNKLTFNIFCEKHLDRLYDSRFSDEQQCSGYINLKKMVVEQINPASLEEVERWENNPTQEELFTIPDIKYLRFLHPLLRPIIIENWDNIKKLPI